MRIIRSLRNPFLSCILLAGLAACAEQPDVNLETEEQALASAKVRLHGIILSEVNSPGLGCRSLEGTTFVASPFDSGGTTITTSNCVWNADAQECECDVVIRTR